MKKSRERENSHSVMWPSEKSIGITAFAPHSPKSVFLTAEDRQRVLNGRENVASIDITCVYSFYHVVERGT